jgi:hypothetical protein
MIATFERKPLGRLLLDRGLVKPPLWIKSVLSAVRSRSTISSASIVRFASSVSFVTKASTASYSIGMACFAISCTRSRG